MRDNGKKGNADMLIPLNSLYAAFSFLSSYNSGAFAFVPLFISLKIVFYAIIYILRRKV